VQGVNVLIAKYVDDAQPGWVECKLTDAKGREWRFVDQLPIVTRDSLHASSTLPQPGVIACEVISNSFDSAGSAITEIDTTRPWGVESTEGVTRFVVRPEQLINFEGAV
jgi:hypothetical protein